MVSLIPEFGAFKAPENKTLVEDILGDLGFRVTWSYDEYRAEVCVFEVAMLGEDGVKEFTRKCLGPSPAVADDLWVVGGVGECHEGPFGPKSCTPERAE